MKTQDLIAGYAAYVDVAELNVSAASEAPATSPVCFAAATSSAACLAATSSGWCVAGAGAGVGGGIAQSVKHGC
ncbi:LxmA leader domain family RiPP [Streptomyces noursei]|uniref:LxmA leader domain family RiPP n=1 Tax=Streptomyces noursei TaxID=1971 RepID=UPI00081CECA4|nr:hypothetical protein SNOUR_24145 [Streptomyces noursei ATCC 11455]MCZ0994907.1 LxmA leader domain family RiPP [Streptomyces noursei]